MFDQPIVTRVGLFVHGLEPAASIHMSDCRYERAMSGANLKYLHHKGHVVVLFKPFRDRFPQDGGRKRTERFPPFDSGIQNIFHIRPARIGQDRTVAQSARAPFHSPLKPADHFAVRDRLRRFAQQFLFGRDERESATSLGDFISFPIEQNMNFLVGRPRAKISRSQGTVVSNCRLVIGD